MNEKRNKTMCEAISAASELNRVKGFDPLKFLRCTHDTMKLDLPYQKLWFRMVHPNGIMRVTALRITEQMAIFEAKVFLERGDMEPFSMSVAQQSSQNSKDFIKAAQNEALSQALTDAGFGIQLINADTQEYHKPINSEMAYQNQTIPNHTQAVHNKQSQMPVNSPQAQDEGVSGNNTPLGVKTSQTGSEGQIKGKLDKKPVHIIEKAEALPIDMKEPHAKEEIIAKEQILPDNKEKTELPVQNVAKAVSFATQTVQTAESVPQQKAAITFTQDMPFEEILRTMTLEQAKLVVVDDGICRGMTIAQVAEKRPVNLRFYLIPGKSKNNVVRAAAQLVLDSLQQVV